MNKLLVAALISIISLPTLSTAKGMQGGRGTTSTLDAQEIAQARFMREEEKLARDVYRVLFATWGSSVFSSISTSEQSHMNAMERLLDRNGIADPVTSDDTGDFTDTELQTWYGVLVDLGSVSLEEAIRVGITIEETDIIDIQAAIDNTDQADFVMTYENLLEGSRNHLRAFITQLESLGLSYVPELLTLEQAYEIVGR